MSTSQFTLCPACFKDHLRPSCPSCGFDPKTYRHGDVSLPPGTSLGYYLVGRPRGQGGFGITYVGYDGRNSQRVAIKEYFPTYMVTRRVGDERPVCAAQLSQEYQNGLRGFLEEAWTLHRFKDHDGIVHVLDCFEHNRTAYMVMEYLSGWTLGTQVLSHGPLLPGQAVPAMLHVMDGLRAVHGAGLIHRDVKPDNIFITRENQIKLIDFGAARHAAAGRSHQLTSILSEPFAPFEQYQSTGVQGPWTDVYATGATMYYLLTGRLPNRGPDRINQDPLVAPSTLNSNVPRDLERVVLRAMSVAPDLRYQSMGEMQAAIRMAVPQAAQERPVEARSDMRTMTGSQATVDDFIDRQVVLAPASHRLGAGLIDLMLIGPAWFAEINFLGAPLITYILSILYFAVMQSSRAASTLGMRATGIQVIRKDGRRVLFWRALGRGALMPLALLFTVSSFHRQQGLHDLITGTIVVTKEGR